MRIAVMGAGGVGGYFGARLAQAGHEVTFIARGRHLEAMRQKGLALKSPLGDAVLKVRAVGAAAEAGPCDIVLFAVKLWDTEEAAHQLRPVVAQGGHVIPFQNGVESVARIGAIVGAQRVMGGAAYIAARIAEPGVIAQTGPTARLRFGITRPAQRGAAEAFLAACRGARVDAEFADDIERVLWEKFVLLVGVSATTTVTRRTLGLVRTDPDLRWLLEAVMRETWALGRERGVKLADDLVAKTLAQADAFAPEMRASMAADLEAGGRLELPWLSGAVARMSAEAGLESPVNRTISAALKPFVDGSAHKAA
jgi:2-dehydropantoate 2-reductase